MALLTSRTSAGGSSAVFRWSNLAEKYGKEFHVPPALLLGDIQIESSGNPRAVSSAGAQGLTQFEPGTFKEYGPPGGSVWNPANAIYAQAHYLRTLYKEYGNWTSALEAYNAGHPTPIAAGYAKKVLMAAQSYGSLTGNLYAQAKAGVRAGLGVSQAQQAAQFAAMTTGTTAQSPAQSPQYGHTGNGWLDFLVWLNNAEHPQFSWFQPVRDTTAFTLWALVKVVLVLMALTLIAFGVWSLVGSGSLSLPAPAPETPAPIPIPPVVE